MHYRSFAALALVCLASTAFSQQPTPATAPEVAPAPPPLNVPKTTAPITLDGDLSDAAWQTAAVIDKFYETSPGNNNLAKIRTVAYLTYDNRYFYIGIRADDPEPKRIRAPFVDRDGVIGTDDNIAIFLDTRNDKRSAIEIRVNPRGIQADGVFNDAGPIEDFSPDFFYDTAAKIDDKGWSAEFRIPFSTLRYDQRDPQQWNILVWRNYPREFRYAFQSAPVHRGANCYMCFMHPLTGLTGLPESGHLVVAPYITGEQVSVPRGGTPGSGLESDDAAIDGGVDVKWNPNANTTLDLTVNPDFSQIEGDIAQITTNRRFAVFFAEKRPFFLEGFDLFDTPFNAAYTRTIHDPKWGARSTGKFGKTAYTFLVAEDRGGGVTLIPGPEGSGFAPQDAKAYTAIGRVRHDLEKMFIGAVLTDREIDGGGHNRVIGPDFQWRPTDGDAITGQLLYSDTDDQLLGADSSGHALHLSWNHLREKYDWFATGRDVADGFRADLGFIPQAGYREIEAGGGLRYFPENSRLRFIRPSVVVYRQDDQDGDTLTQGVSFGVNGFGAKNTQFFFGYRPKEEIRVAGDLLNQAYWNAFVSIDPSRRFPRISLDARWGDQISFGQRAVGDGFFLSLAATVRPHDRLDLQANIARETLDVAGSRQFTVMIERLRAQYSFSAKSLLRVIGQYVNEDSLGGESGDFTGSILYSYKINWQTVLFAGYGDNRVLLDDNLEPSGRSFFFKVSYAYQR